MRLDGKTALVTGASQGLGFEIARALARAGASVLICARTPTDLERAEKQLHSESPGQIFALRADVSKADDARRLADSALNKFGRLDVFVSNAAIYGSKGPAEETPWDEWCQTIEVNLYGTVLCYRHLLPLIKKSARGKILFLSGGGATKPLPFLSAYAVSKAAIVRFGETVSEELKRQQIDVNMIAPGGLNTRLLDEILQAGPSLVGQSFYDAAVKQKQCGGVPLDRVAALCVYLSSEASDGITGKLISAPWDPWERLGEWRADLQSTDIYTLRRIVPEDRGKDWH